MVDSGAFHINTVLQCVSYQSLEKGMTSANTYGSDSYPVDRYIAVFGLREDCGSGWGVRGLPAGLRQAKTLESFKAGLR